jgi:hypothetical protein
VDEAPFYPTSSLTPVISGVFSDDYSNRGRWNVCVVLICVSFIPRDGEHFFICFLAI